jgi:hypothetical protein
VSCIIALHDIPIIIIIFSHLENKKKKKKQVSHACTIWLLRAALDCSAFYWIDGDGEKGACLILIPSSNDSVPLVCCYRILVSRNSWTVKCCLRISQLPNPGSDQAVMCILCFQTKMSSVLCITFLLIYPSLSLSHSLSLSVSLSLSLSCILHDLQWLQVVFKCCKLIPVMLLGIFILRKHYSLLDYAAAGLFCSGLIVFTLADKSLSPSFDPMGIALISAALVADAFIGNLQVS